VLIAIFLPLPSPAMEFTLPVRERGKMFISDYLLFFNHTFYLCNNVGNIVQIVIPQPQNPHPKLVKEKRKIVQHPDNKFPLSTPDNQLIYDGEGIGRAKQLLTIFQIGVRRLARINEPTVPFSILCRF
jgi:hypothetical protein